MKKLSLLIVLGLAGCATHMSQKECVSTNWQLEGMNDAVAGHPLRDLTQAAQDCQQYKIAINRDAYVVGWNLGMKRYCAPDFNLGFADGSIGKNAYDITDRNPACLQAGLSMNLKAYEQGRQKGLKSFCTFENGVMIARLGQPLPEVCPKKSRFVNGWNSGAQQLCNQTRNAYALGRDNKPYPEACSPEIFLAFKAEYDRGAAIAVRMRELQDQLTQTNEKISDMAASADLVRRGEFYDLGQDQSAHAQDILNQVRGLQTDKQHLENDLFNLKVMR